MEDCVDTTIQGLKKYRKRSKERSNITTGNKNVNKRTNSKTRKSRKQKWKAKQLYGYFKQQIEEITYQMTETW